jgi:enterochelin esterase-like enzyme
MQVSAPNKNLLNVPEWRTTMNHTQFVIGFVRVLKQAAAIGLYAALLSVALCILAGGQEKQTPSPVMTFPAPTPNDTLKSVEVQPNGMVIFRLYAPNAKEVRLDADGPEATPNLTWEQFQKNKEGVPMKRSENGIWSVSFGPIQPGTYSYLYIVDGVRFADPRNPDSAQTLNTVRSLYEVPGNPYAEYRDGVPHGAVSSVLYHSNVTKGLRRMHIYTPPGYEKGGDAQYPVLYLLHGGNGSDDDWESQGRSGAIFDNLIAKGKAVPMIVVMPAGHMSRDFRLAPDTTTSIGHDGFNDELIGSVIPFVDSHYRTRKDRDHRAIAGLSMGGIQTLNIALANSEYFNYVGVFSSGWFSQIRDQEERTTLAQYKEKGKPFKLCWMGVGKLDIAYENSGPTADLLRKYGIQPVTHESGGFHSWNNWSDYLALFTPQLFH